MRMTFSQGLRSLKIMASNWEYWPWYLVYIPVFIHFAYLSIRARSLTFFSNVNRPYMKYGGLFEESKHAMYQRTPMGLIPKIVLLNSAETDVVMEAHKNSNLGFPFIIKPDHGLRGKGVHLIHSYGDLEDIKLPNDYIWIIQEYCPYELEIGVLCLKDPRTNKWRITSLMQREFLRVIGDGSSNLGQLIASNDRAFLQLQRLHQKFDLNSIPEKDEVIELGKIGNHRLGTRFIDKAELISPILTQAMSKLCNQLEGFEFGRLDIKFKNWEDLIELKNFAIIEVNGTNSEPAHIYDSKHRFTYGLNQILLHWKYIYTLHKQANKSGKKSVSLPFALSLFADYRSVMRNL